MLIVLGVRMRIEHKLNAWKEFTTQSSSKLARQAERSGHAENQVIRQNDCPVAKPFDTAEVTQQVEIGDS